MISKSPVRGYNKKRREERKEGGEKGDKKRNLGGWGETFYVLGGPQVTGVNRICYAKE